MRRKNIFEKLMAVLAVKAFADNATTTNYSTQNGGVPLTNGVRVVYSREIEFHALPLMRFSQFATIKTELGVQPGDTISMMTYDNLKLGGKLTEMVDMTTQALSSSMKQIKVSEHGNAVSNTELLIQTSFTDVMRDTTRLLGRDYALVMDTELRDTALSGTNVVYANKRDSRDDIEATDKFNVAVVKDGIEVLSTKNAPKREGAYWICFVQP